MLYNNFFSQVWYTPLSERDSLVPSRFLIKPINYRTYSAIYNRQILPDGIIQEQPHDVILKESVIAIENMDIDISEDWIAMLPPYIYSELINIITSLYLPDQDFYEILNVSLDIAVNPRFSGETWDCAACQLKKLHFQRNCYLVPEEEHEDTFGVQVLGEIVRKCPMNKKDNLIIDAALSARNIKESGSLPEVGGLGDQTVFFAIASQKAHSVIEQYKNKQMEEHSAKSKSR